MEKQFVTYEIALKLKEIGFDEECFGYYTPIKDWMMKGKYSDGKLHFHGPNWANNDNTMYFMYLQNSFGDRNCTTKNSRFTKAIYNIAVPLWQQAVNWFRSKNIFVSVNHTIGNMRQGISSLTWHYTILEFKDGYTCSSEYKTYEETVENAILKAVELIKKHKLI